MNMKRFFELLKNYNFLFLIKKSFEEVVRIVWKNMIRGSYSQNYEDLIINKIINKTKGVYLEIGGYHPTRLSNTYFFYKKGWRGTVVEPNPEVKKLFKKVRPEDKFINSGISDKYGIMNYYNFMIPAINTFSKIEASNSIKRGHKLEKVIKIKTIKINELVDGEIDLLSLDTEGFDKKILNSWPWHKIKPKIICVESNVIKMLEKKGYKVVTKNKVNTIFVFGKSGFWGDRKQ